MFLADHITSLLLMHWLTLCVTLCITSAVVNAFGLTPGLGSALEWSNQDCVGQGSVGTSGVTWQYSGDTVAGSTLTVTGTNPMLFPEIEDGAHWKADSLCYQAIKEINVKNMEYIGVRAFNNIPSFYTVNAPTVTMIGDYAFEGSYVDSGRLSLANLQQIGTGSFKGAQFSGTGMALKGILTIYDYAFEGSTIDKFDITEATVRLNKGVFRDCVSLTSFYAGSNLETVPESMFEGCINLWDITASLAMRNFGKRAFFACPLGYPGALTVVEGVAISIGESAFETSGLESIDFSAATSVTIGKAAFKNCQQLQSFSSGNTPNIPESCFEGCDSLLGFYPTVPMREIGKRAFFQCFAMDCFFTTAEVTTLIGESAFENTRLKSVDLSTHADSFTIGASAFRYCLYLESMTWSSTYPTMPDSIFETTGLRSVDIPATVTEFGENCFRDCFSLQHVTYHGHAEAPSSMFIGCDLVSVTVPDDYPYDQFGGYIFPERGLSLGAQIGIGVGVAVFVIIVIVIVVVVLFVTGKIGGGKRDADEVEA